MTPIFQNAQQFQTAFQQQQQNQQQSQSLQPLQHQNETFHHGVQRTANHRRVERPMSHLSSQSQIQNFRRQTYQQQHRDRLRNHVANTQREFFRDRQMFTQQQQRDIQREQEALNKLDYTDEELQHMLAYDDELFNPNSPNRGDNNNNNLNRNNNNNTNIDINNTNYSFSSNMNSSFNSSQEDEFGDFDEIMKDGDDSMFNDMIDEEYDPVETEKEYEEYLWQQCQALQANESN